MKVYLAGPITGLSYEGATDWRQQVKRDLANHNVIGVSPLRAKDYLTQKTTLADAYEDVSILSTQKGVVTRDRWDAMGCDIVLANLIGADRVSIGTVMEIAWADATRTPIVLAMESGNPHDHAMVREVSGFIAPSLQEAVDLVIALRRTA